MSNKALSVAIDTLGRVENGQEITVAQYDAAQLSLQEHINGTKDAVKAVLEDDSSFKDSTIQPDAVLNTVLTKGYMTCTGTANAITASFPGSATLPTPTELIGMPLWITVQATNTAADVTLTVNRLAGTTAGYIRFGTSALRVADLLIGKIVCVTWDGTQFQLQSVLSPSSSGESPLTGAKNLVMLNASAKTMTVTADEVVMKKITGSTSFFRTTAFSATWTMDAGQIAGGTDAAIGAGWWHLYAVAKEDGSGIHVVASASATAPTLGSVTGYSATTSFYCYLGAVYATSGTVLRTTNIEGRTASIASTEVVTALTGVTAWTAISGAAKTTLNTLVPPNAKKIRLLIGAISSGLDLVTGMSVAMNTSAIGESSFVLALIASNFGTANWRNVTTVWVPVTYSTGVEFAYLMSATTASRYQIHCSGYEI